MRKPPLFKCQPTSLGAHTDRDRPAPLVVGSGLRPSASGLADRPTRPRPVIPRGSDSRPSSPPTSTVRALPPVAPGFRDRLPPRQRAGRSGTPPIYWDRPTRIGGRNA